MRTNSPTYSLRSHVGDFVRMLLLLTMRIAITQICSTNNILQNAQTASKLIEQAFKKNCEIIFFPEATDYIASNAQESLELARTSTFIDSIKNTVKQFPINVSVGVHLPAVSKTRNVLLFINKHAEIINSYQKQHLFDMGALRESDSVEKGLKLPELIEVGGFKFAPQICFDIRFPVDIKRLVNQGADVLLFPSAFTMKTGKAHWEILNRCRAIDSQCYVISSAQAGKHNSKRESYGHAIVVDPWGEVLVEVLENGLEVVDLDLKRLAEVRNMLPLN